MCSCAPDALTVRFSASQHVALSSLQAVSLLHPRRCRARQLSDGPLISRTPGSRVQEMARTPTAEALCTVPWQIGGSDFAYVSYRTYSLQSNLRCHFLQSQNVSISVMTSSHRDPHARSRSRSSTSRAIHLKRFWLGCLSTQNGAIQAVSGKFRGTCEKVSGAELNGKSKSRTSMNCNPQRGVDAV